MSAFFQRDEYREVISPLSGRRVLVNESATKFFLPPKLDLAKLRADIAAFVARPREQTRTFRAWSHVWKPWAALADVADDERVVELLEEMLCYASQRKSTDRMACAVKLLVVLWARGHLGLPAHLPAAPRKMSIFSEAILGPQFDWVSEVVDAVAGITDKAHPRLVHEVMHLSMGTVGLVDADDLCARTVSRHALANYGIGNYVFRGIRLVQQRTHPAEKVLQTSGVWRAGKQPRVYSDPEFMWALTAGDSMENWREHAAAWVAQSTSTLKAICSGNFLLRYVAEKPQFPRSPPEFLCMGSKHADDLHSALQGLRAGRETHTNKLHEFFNWILMSRLKDSRGAHCNPLTRLQSGPTPCETHRIPVPTKFVRELIEIVRSDWPRSLRADWVDVKTERGIESVWSPVRASAILLKLLLPLRTSQVRFLESDEGDTLRWSEGKWVKNTLPTAPPDGCPVKRSFLRSFSQGDGEKLGFFVNTNKSRTRDGADVGYEMPWSHEAVIRIVEDLSSWQATYNALDKPLAWSDLTDLISEIAGRPQSGGACFLMRDPAARKVRNEPVSDVRLRRFWLALLEELERRLAARGETRLDGSPIRLIATRTSKGQPEKPVFDLHSLRVSFITAMAVDGGVPLVFLSKSLAGHASILMTLHYVKLNADQMNETMNEAARRIDANERANFAKYLSSVDREARRSYVSNGPEGASVLQSVDELGWSLDEIGMCPTGRTLCHRGGPEIDGKTQPTLGSPRNCLRCKYFVSGPAFLPGLVARFNALGVRLHGAAEEYRDACAEHDALDGEQHACREDGRPFTRAVEYDTALQRRERATGEVDRIAHDWHACYALVERCKAAMKEPGGGDGTSLVLGGSRQDLTTALKAATEFELMNAVCQSARLFPCPEVEVARLRRARVLNAVLAGTPGARRLATLTREESIEVGNEVSKLLLAKFSGEDLEAAAAGRNVLDAAGLTASMVPLMEHRPAALELKLLPSSTFHGAA